MAATALSILALCLSGALASPCAPEGVSGDAPIHKVTRTVVKTRTVPWADHSLPVGSSTSTANTGEGWPGGSSSISRDHSSSVTTTSSSRHAYGNHTTLTSSTLITSTTSSAITTTSTTSTTSTPSFYIQYAPVPGYFLQDDPATDPTGFDYSLTNFGLINRTYPSSSSSSSSELTQWQNFALHLTTLQSTAPAHTTYKLLFLGRHGQGTHNAMETYIGTPAWNCYWALLDGANSSYVYADAPVTSEGIAQAEKANAYWRSRLEGEGMPGVQSFYSSPLRRCLETARLTFRGLSLIDGEGEGRVVVKEGLREGMSEHTCNRRSTRSWIAAAYPSFIFEAGFTENDELWTGTTTEVSAAQDFRSKQLLDDIFSSDDNTYLSFTSHSGEITSLLRVIGHRPFRLSTGQIIPVLVRAETITPQEATTTISSASWTPSPFCTEPPVTSVPSWGDGGGCVCQSSAEPVITQLPPFPNSEATPTS